MLKPPMLTGCIKRRLDASRRLRMPTAWSIGSSQTWLLFPRHIVPPCDQVSHSLYLLPVNEPSLRAIIASSPTHTACAPTLDAVLDLLHAQARRHALDPSVATAIRTTPIATRFTLTKAQIEWFGSRGRTLVVVGALNAARIYTPTAWANVKRSARPYASRRLPFLTLSHPTSFRKYLAPLRIRHKTIASPCAKALRRPVSHG
jgi:hypothetical protein